MRTESTDCLALLPEGDLFCDFKHNALSYLRYVVGEVDFVEDLGAVQLDGIYLDLVGWELPGLHPAQRQ